MCPKKIILAQNLTKLYLKVTFVTQDVTIHKTTPTACNKKTLKQELTIVTQDITTLKQEVTKNIHDMIIHKRITTTIKKDNANQIAELEKGRPKQGIGVNTRRLLTMYLKDLSFLSV